jgi:hypothetical protein
MTREEEFISILEKKGYGYRIEGESLIVDHDGDVWLGGLKTLPPNIEFRNRGSVGLNSLTSLPSNIGFRNGRHVWLNGLKTLPSNVKFRNSGSVWLGSISRLPIEDLDHIFRNNGDIWLFGGWISDEEFPESRWESVELITEK